MRGHESAIIVRGSLYSSMHDEASGRSSHRLGRGHGGVCVDRGALRRGRRRDRGADGGPKGEGGPVGADGGPVIPTNDARPDRDPSCTCSAAPDGWARVAYAGDRSAPCPTAAARPILVTEPARSTGACACATCQIVPRRATAARTARSFDTGATPQCNQQGAQRSASGQCEHVSGTLGDHRALPASPSGPSACTAGGRGRVESRRVRSACSKGSQCPCEVSAPFASRMKAPGDVACPEGFPTKHLVGTATAACGVRVHADRRDLQRNLTFFLGSRLQQRPSGPSATPRALPTTAHTFDSLRYTGSLASATCKTTPGTASDASLAETSTVCCP